MSWHCIHEVEGKGMKFCPPEGCSKSYGCARDVAGWKPGDPTPEGCDGITRVRTTGAPDEK